MKIQSASRPTRREFLVGTAAAGATVFLAGAPFAAPVGKQTFTILYTNDMHSNLIELGPALDYSPFTLNDDKTRWFTPQVTTCKSWVNPRMTAFVRAIAQSGIVPPSAQKVAVLIEQADDT